MKIKDVLILEEFVNLETDYDVLSPDALVKVEGDYLVIETIKEDDAPKATMRLDLNDLEVLTTFLINSSKGA